jgi:MoxR-like ATPase
MMVDMLKANAYLNSRNYATDQDLVDLSIDVFAHRLIATNPQIDKRDLISKITRVEVRNMLSAV